MNVKICPICNNPAPERLKKGDIPYFQCISCKTLFSGSLDNSNMVGGGNEEERNLKQNAIRIKRIDELIGKIKSTAKVLDYGCGHGMLVKDLILAGYKAEGYDAYNEKYQRKPTESFQMVTMVEVIEHLSDPFNELDFILKHTYPGAAIYIETSFVDIADEEGIPLEEFFYIEPKVGHATIFSHHGLDLLMALKGFLPLQHFDRNVRLYQKP